jgi:hypothetical protein
VWARQSPVCPYILFSGLSFPYQLIFMCKGTIKREKKQKNFGFSEREYLRDIVSEYD